MSTRPSHSGTTSARTTEWPPESADDRQRRKEVEQWLRRRRLVQQLHDGASLRISALSLRLGLLRHHDRTDDAGLQDSIRELQDELHAVLQELREVAGKIYPPLLDQAGLGPALQELADQPGAAVSVVATGERFGPVAEGAAYFAIAEYLASPPAPGAQVQVVVGRESHGLVLSISGVHPGKVDLMQDQARPLGGTVDIIDGHPPGNATITVRIPCE